MSIRAAHCNEGHWQGKHIKHGTCTYTHSDTHFALALTIVGAVLNTAVAKTLAQSFLSSYLLVLDLDGKHNQVKERFKRQFHKLFIYSYFMVMQCRHLSTHTTILDFGSWNQNLDLSDVQ